MGMRSAKGLNSSLVLLQKIKGLKHQPFEIKIKKNKANSKLVLKANKQIQKIGSKSILYIVCEKVRFEMKSERLARCQILPRKGTEKQAKKPGQKRQIKASKEGPKGP
ncbi:hypothetical protein KY338_05385 [Candidatus Woesearchaeota archaeon]|nr:hypothetical protein [Candidatus Woesearchaeota archaeon]